MVLLLLLLLVVVVGVVVGVGVVRNVAGHDVRVMRMLELRVMVMVRILKDQ